MPIAYTVTNHVREKEYPGIADPPKTSTFRYPEGDVLKGTVVKEVRRDLRDYVDTSDTGRDYVFVIQRSTMEISGWFATLSVRDRRYTWWITSFALLG